MKFLSPHSSVVMIGESYLIGAFDVDEHSKILGKVDRTKSVVMPVLSDYAFENSPFHIQLLPEKAQIDYKNEEIFPESLREIGLAVANALTSGSPQGQVNAVGINLNLTISPDELGMSGVEYCARNFITDQERWIKNVAPAKEFSSAGRVTYDVGNIRYTIRFEPHYKTDMNNLFIAANAHQETAGKVTYTDALGNYGDIRGYLLHMVEKALAST